MFSLFLLAEAESLITSSVLKKLQLNSFLNIEIRVYPLFKASMARKSLL